MRQTPVDDYLEEISTELPEELYGNLSDAIYETVCEFDEEVAQLKAENAKLRDGAYAMRQLYEDELKHALAENAKLRELVKKLVILAFARCADCDLLDASCALVSTQKCLLWNECESIARELGVEVD